MTVQLDKNVKYAKDLVGAIAAAIRAGDLREGERLPSIRDAAERTGLSVGTVASAYRTLGRRGLVVNSPGKRSEVARTSRIDVPLSLQSLPGSVDAAGLNPDPALLPDLGALLSPNLYEPLVYDSPGLAPEFQQMAESLFAADGVTGELTATNGALDAIERVLRATLEPGDRVIVEDPVWPAISGLMRNLGLMSVPVPLDNEGFVPKPFSQALLDPHVKAVLATPRAQNPTGACFTASRSEELRHILSGRPEVLLVEDDHFALVSLAPHHSLSGSTERFALVRSFAKALGPDLRIAVMCSDAETAQLVRLYQGLGPGWVSHTIQRLVARALSSEDIRGAVHSAALVYQERREAALAALAARGVDAQGQSGLTVMICVPDAAAVGAALAARGWLVQFGQPALPTAQSFLRVCVSRLTPELSADLAAVLSTVLNYERRWNR